MKCLYLRQRQISHMMGLRISFPVSYTHLDVYKRQPLSNLDAKLRVQMRSEIASLHNRLKATIILSLIHIYSREETEKLGIMAGDFVCFDPRTTVTKTGYIKSRFLDDKLSVGILLGYAKYLKEENIDVYKRQI